MNNRNNVVNIRVKDDKRQGNTNKILGRHLFLVTLVVVVCYFVYSIGLPIFETQKLEDEIAQIDKEIALVKKNNNELKEKIVLLKTDTYVERMAREKLGYIKPGEVLIVPAEQGKEKEIDTSKPLY